MALCLCCLGNLHQSPVIFTVVMAMCLCCLGNLHQSQYCDKLRSIVEFLGTQLSMEELTTMWDMQVDKNPVQVGVTLDTVGVASVGCGIG